MVLSINAATANNTTNYCDENASPLKRKSELISPSCRADTAAADPSASKTSSSSSFFCADEVRCPLSEINTISEHDANIAKSTSNEVVLSSVPHSNSSTTTTMTTTTRQSTLPKKTLSTANTTGTATTYCGIKYNKFKSHNRPSKDDIEATNEKQASVNQLSEWLANEASKKNKKIPIIDRPPLSASDINLLRFQNKPRIKKSDVEATDDKRVSVKTISSWMSDDPFEQKKVRTIRTGHKIIAKSRVFEKDTVLMASRKCDIKAGSVEEKSAWLSGAFKHEGTGEDSSISTSLAEKKVIRPNPVKSTKKVEEEHELKSVKDKKEWLSNAFAKKGSESSSAMTRHEKSNEWHPIQQSRSYEVNHYDDTAPSIVQSVSADNYSHHAPKIYQTKSYDREEESSLENKLKSVREKKEWLSNAFAKKENDHCKQNEVQHPRPEDTNPTPSLPQTKSIEMNNDFDVPGSLNSKSMDNSRSESTNYQKRFDGPTRSRQVATTEKKRDEGVILYQKEANEAKISPENTSLKTVKDKQAWLSNAFKTPASSSPVKIGGVTKQLQTKGVVQGDVASDKIIAVDRVMNLTTCLSTTAEANEKPHDNYKKSEEDLEKMSVAERAKWLKMAFK